jgi:hypothetical protein
VAGLLSSAHSAPSRRVGIGVALAASALAITGTVRRACNPQPDLVSAGGIWLALLYALLGILAFILIITIPFGFACFRIATFCALAVRPQDRAPTRCRRALDPRQRRLEPRSSAPTSRASSCSAEKKNPAPCGASKARPERFELPTFGSVDRIGAFWRLRVFDVCPANRRFPRTWACRRLRRFPDGCLSWCLSRAALADPPDRRREDGRKYPT